MENGKIRGYGIIFNVIQITDGLKKGLRCETTGRVWGKEGDRIVGVNDWLWLSAPVSFKGFQGIRYVDRLPDLEKELAKQIR